MDSKLNGFGEVSEKKMFFRADQIDLKKLDIQLEKTLSRVWTMSRTNTISPKPKEEWEIDLAKLDIRHVVAKGTYGTVYRGNYDGKDVAGMNFRNLLFSHVKPV